MVPRNDVRASDIGFLLLPPSSPPRENRNSLRSGASHRSPEAREVIKSRHSQRAPNPNIVPDQLCQEPLDAVFYPSLLRRLVCAPGFDIVSALARLGASDSLLGLLGKPVCRWLTLVLCVPKSAKHKLQAALRGSLSIRNGEKTAELLKTQSSFIKVSSHCGQRLQTKNRDGECWHGQRREVAVASQLNRSSMQPSLCSLK